MLSQIIQEVKNNFNFHVPNFLKKKYLILFSGGMDSVLLTEIMSTIIPANNIFLLYCHYHLREQENILEVDLLKKIAAAKNIQHFIHQASLKKYSKNLQAEARRIRFIAAEKIQEEQAIDFLITAHHADDFLETFFMKILAGKSPQNLVGMLTFKKGGTLRPLFSLEKQVISSLVKKNNFSYVEDSSNQKSIYQRNYLRNEVFPLLDDRFPHWKNNVTLFAKHLQGYNQLAQKKIEDWGRVKKDFFFLKKGFFSLPTSKRLMVLHNFFTLLYPAKRFSQNFFKAINKKIADGRNSKILAVIADKKIVYSYGWVGKKIPYLSQVVGDEGSIMLDDVIIAFNPAKLKIQKNPQQIKEIRQIVVNSPVLNKVVIASLPLFTEITYGAKKTTCKKLLSDNKIPQMMRNSLFGVFLEKRLLAVINPYHFLGLKKFNLLLEEINNNLEKQEKRVTVAYLK